MSKELTTTGTASAPMSLDAMRQLAESVAKSRLFGIQTADQALTLMSIAQAEGRHPALAARDYHIIQGTPAKKAEAMLRDFITSGGRVEWHELSDTAAEATFAHPAGGTVRLRWDQNRVKQAQLANPMHKKYPRQMLRSRLISEGVRTVCPMATSGLYVPEEVADFAPQRAAAPIDVTPKRDLDQFAAGGEIIDAETGEVTELHDDSPAMLAARGGKDAFRAFWKDLTPDERHMLRQHLDEYQRAAEAADRAHQDDEDPFGLPSIDGATESPAGDPVTSDNEGTIATADDGPQTESSAPAGDSSHGRCSG